ncbi:MAG: FecR domain-containing protein [Anaerolineales bacterium]|nr:FecR domain-containing protein [Anaerolineales bacterium]
MSEIRGAVEIKNPGQEGFSSAENGMSLQVGGELRTGENGYARLDLSTGTLIRMAPNTSFMLVSNEPTDDGLLSRLQVELGQIWIALTGGEVEVETPSGVAAVRGSHLMIWVDPATLDVWVNCFEGECGADNGDLLGLTGGQGTILYFFTDGNPPPPELRLLTWDEFLAWVEVMPEYQSLLPDIIATLTAMAPPPPPAPPLPTATVPPAEPACTLQLLSPANGADLPESGAVTFTWNPQEGAGSYLVTFTSSGGAMNSFSATGSSLTRYIESLPTAGAYSWQVTALDAYGQEICSTGPSTFSKPQSAPPPPPVTTEAPAAPPNNTVFTYLSGPFDPTYPPGQYCSQYFAVGVTDVEGVKNVWLAFKIYNYLGDLIASGQVPLPYDTDGFWAGQVLIMAVYGDVVTWNFLAEDNLGNFAASTWYSYTDIGCILP